MASNNICIGIDLGTTNSVIAWGKVGSKEDLVEPEIIDVRMFNKDGALVSTRLLPSCVHFPVGKNYPIVGEYGKEFTDPNDVKRTAKSFKIKMGDKNWSKKIDGKSYNATDFSSMVLRHLKESAERTLFSNIPFPDDVAIAVPACFEQHMRDETYRAAIKAGFEKPVVVTETRAILYDLENRMSLGLTSHINLDFKIPKLVLIFDLGGGTLDVSLYTVHFGKDQPGLQWQLIGITRFTDIGGDNFDQKLADYLLQKSDVVDTSEKEALEHRFLLDAENAKIELSTQIEIWKIYGESDELNTDSISAQTCELSLSQYAEGVKELLADHLTWESIDQYNPSEKPQNIIDPIFDVLKQSEKNLGYIPKPDIVMLNGSMAKTYTIQKRLETFFGVTPVDVGDMEFNVARGAVAYLAKRMSNL